MPLIIIEGDDNIYQLKFSSKFNKRDNINNSSRFSDTNNTYKYEYSKIFALIAKIRKTRSPLSLLPKNSLTIKEKQSMVRDSQVDTTIDHY